jgi:hypothetical protein
MTLDDRGGEGVWEGPKKDDVIYEQPLTKWPNISQNLNLTGKIIISKLSKTSQLWYKCSKNTLIGNISIYRERRDGWWESAERQKLCSCCYFDKFYCYYLISYIELPGLFTYWYFVYKTICQSLSWVVLYLAYYWQVIQLSWVEHKSVWMLPLSKINVTSIL